MTYRPVKAFPGPAQVPATAGGLKPEAIGLGQDTIIGMATSAPASSKISRADQTSTPVRWCSVRRTAAEV